MKEEYKYCDKCKKETIVYADEHCDWCSSVKPMFEELNGRVNYNCDNIGKNCQDFLEGFKMKHIHKFYPTGEKETKLIKSKRELLKWHIITPKEAAIKYKFICECGKIKWVIEK